ncbi:MAG: manganese efflux pump MntP family protein [Bacillota bacterium]|nr:manganese efflux pump MntP family protein [Bacillota bacterium]
MGFLDLFLIAVALSMDAFAVSVCKGLSVGKLKPKHSLIAGAYFGGFQALMPVVGFLLGFKFEKFIVSVDHWIAFVLLAVIGANMIKEALGGDEDEVDSSFGFKAMLPMAVATSIDALAVGITFAFLNVSIVKAAALIGITTFVLSAIGVVVGNLFGAKYKSKAELLGGIVLILIGLKILLEHLGILSF